MFRRVMHDFGYFRSYISLQVPLLELEPTRTCLNLSIAANKAFIVSDSTISFSLCFLI